MELSPEFKREIKRLFSKQTDIAINIHKGNDVEATLEQISKATGISITFLNQNMKDLRVLAFQI